MRRREHPLAQHIGNAHGRIAIWCDESEAWDIASHYPWPDKFAQEIGDAIALAYPPEAETPQEPAP